MSIDTEQRNAVFALAKQAVIGVAAARLSGNETDAAFLLSKYHEDATALQVRDTTAWALLFSAAIVSLADALTVSAEDHHQSPAAELSELALRQESA